MDSMDKVIQLNDPGISGLKESFKKREREMRWPGKLTVDELKDKKFSIFHNYYYPESVTLSEIIKILGWGSNRVIRQQGFRVLTITNELKPIKQWDRITDPNFFIKESSYISQPKGQSIVTIHIGVFP